MDDRIKSFLILDGIDRSLLENIKLLYIFKYIEVFIVTKNDDFYCYGRNEFGCLGTGDEEHCDTPKKIEELCGKEIIDITSGFSHVVARTQDGGIYSWGQNDCGQLGHSEINNDPHKPKLVDNMKQHIIVQICCGKNHSLALNDKGEVYAWGSNEWGEVGNGKAPNHQEKPILLTGFGRDKVSTISCGQHHSLALTENNKVYTWGSGWLRENKISEPNQPKIVRVLTKMRDTRIKKIICGKDHSLLLSLENDIYAFGRNVWDENESNHSKYINTPKKFINSQKFSEIAASAFSNLSVALSFEGKFVIWNKKSEEVQYSHRVSKLKSFHDVFSVYTKQKITYQRIWIEDQIIPNSLTYDEKYYSEYEELDILQYGKYGLVCRAKNTHENSEIYAIKKIPLEKFKTEGSISIEESIEILDKLVKLNSDYVVDYKDVWIEENYFLLNDSISLLDEGQRSENFSKISKSSGSHLLHIQMEISFGTLKDFISKLRSEIPSNSSEFLNQIKFYISCELFSEILDCINYLHKQPTPIQTHRFLNPAKILITNGLNCRFVKIADFSCRLIHNDQHEEMISAKEYKYIAPEVLRQLDYDTKADIYSLGVIFHQIINNDFKKYIDQTTGDSSNENDSPINSKISNILEYLNEMLLYFPKNRPNCQELIDDKKSWFFELDSIDNSSQLTELKDKSKLVWEMQDSFFLYFLKKKMEYADKDKKRHTKTSISMCLDYTSDGKYGNEYQEVRLIGYGSFAVVCEAEEKKTKDKFAIKIIPIEENYNKLAIRELEILTKNKVDSIVKCKSFWIEKNYARYLEHRKGSSENELHIVRKPLFLFIQMELCYKTLKEVIEIVNSELKQNFFSRMTPTGYYIACELVIELLEGVDYLHKCVPAIIHRDLKPSNILISFGTNGKFVKIADFGLSTLHLSDDQSHSRQIGTRGYMSPEVMESRKYDTYADIFSIGKIIPKVFNFEFEKCVAGYHRILNKRYENLNNIIQEMVETDVQKRPSCETVLKNSDLWRLYIGDIKNDSVITNIESDPTDSIDESFHKYFIRKKMEQMPLTEITRWNSLKKKVVNGDHEPAIAIETTN